MKGNSFLKRLSGTEVAPARPQNSGEWISDPHEWIEHAARVKLMKRILGKKPREGSRYNTLQNLALAEATLGHNSVRLDHFSITEAFAEAQRENDWAFLKALSGWHDRRKPLSPDPLAKFMADNFKQLRGLNDREIAAKAKEKCIKDVTLFRVRDCRLMLQRVLAGKPPRSKTKQPKL